MSTNTAAHEAATIEAMHTGDYSAPDLEYTPISVSLPLAIAAFSHVQAQQREKRHTATGETADETPPAPAIAPEAPEETPAPVAPPAIAPRSSADIARELQVSRQTVDGWKRRGTLEINIARRRPTVAAPTANGNGGTHV